jgi:hypothetical protein
MGEFFDNRCSKDSLWIGFDLFYERQTRQQIRQNKKYLEKNATTRSKQQCGLTFLALLTIFFTTALPTRVMSIASISGQLLSSGNWDESSSLFLFEATDLEFVVSAHETIDKR